MPPRSADLKCKACALQTGKVKVHESIARVADRLVRFGGNFIARLPRKELALKMMRYSGPAHGSTELALK